MFRGGYWSGRFGANRRNPSRTGNACSAKLQLNRVSPDSAFRGRFVEQGVSGPIDETPAEQASPVRPNSKCRRSIELIHPIKRFPRLCRGNSRRHPERGIDPSDEDVSRQSRETPSERRDIESRRSLRGGGTGIRTPRALPPCRFSRAVPCRSVIPPPAMVEAFHARFKPWNRASCPGVAD